MADIKKQVMGVSLGVAVLMLVGKLSAYFLTGSKAIFSDAAESIVHIAATGVAAASLWYASRPADRQHHYGHGKIAYFSAGFEGAFILAAAIAILYESIEALIVGPELQRLGLGLLITGALGLVNLALGLTLISVGRRHRSVIVEANGKHVLTDMWTSLAVVLGVTIVWLTGILWLDPVIAMLAGLHILSSAVGLIHQAYDGLLDRADPEITDLVLEPLRNAVSEGRISDFHRLRHRTSNEDVWIDLHVLVPGELRADEAHARVTKLESEIRAALPDRHVEIITHIEPADHEAAHPGEGREHQGPLDESASTESSHR